ncbi:hypothetical protein EAO77_24055 [Streptomyces sp. t39]|nr:hypothetical protein EAO77_24055 [Streptomyces sp. t39]
MRKASPVPNALDAKTLRPAFAPYSMHRLRTPHGRDVRVAVLGLTNPGPHRPASTSAARPGSNATPRSPPSPSRQAPAARTAVPHSTTSPGATPPSST